MSPQLLVLGARECPDCRQGMYWHGSSYYTCENWSLHTDGQRHEFEELIDGSLRRLKYSLL